MNCAKFRSAVIRILLCVLAFALVNNPVNGQSYSSRDKYEQPDKIMESVGIKEGMKIGEVGAGRGYLTFKMSPKVGETGKIYANDIDKRALKFLNDKIKREKIKNIETVLGELTDPLFPVKDLDMIIMIHVFHDLEKPVEFSKKARKYLKPGCQLVIIDWDPAKYPDPRNHCMKKEDVLKNMSKAGFKLDRIEEFLQRDNIYIYR